VLKDVHSVYDLNQHYLAGSAASQVIDDELVDTFAIVSESSGPVSSRAIPAG
jgi:hypothetical protein